jgi:hypothetical protein
VQKRRLVLVDGDSCDYICVPRHPDVPYFISSSTFTITNWVSAQRRSDMRKLLMFTTVALLVAGVAFAHHR